MADKTIHIGDFTTKDNVINLGDFSDKGDVKNIDVSAPEVSEEQLKKNSAANEEWAKKSLVGKASDYLKKIANFPMDVLTGNVFSGRDLEKDPLGYLAEPVQQIGEYATAIPSAVNKLIRGGSAVYDTLKNGGTAKEALLARRKAAEEATFTSPLGASG